MSTSNSVVLTILNLSGHSYQSSTNTKKTSDVLVNERRFLIKFKA